MILIVSHAGDAHAARVMEQLQTAGRDVLLFDLSALPHRATLSVDYPPGGAESFTYRLRGRAALDLAAVESIWWRRPQAPDLSAIVDPDVHVFTHNEWQEALNGLWQLLDARWMNPPIADERAGRKALQLKLARELGLETPRTLITSDADAARAFIGAHGLGNVIFKTFSCTHAVWRETRLVRQAEVDALDSLALAPVIFQEYIEAEADLRVTVVGRRVFPMAIHAADTDYPVDFRMSLGQARTEPTTLPADVTSRLLTLMDRLGLVYGAIDLRRTREGRYVFLEVNTAGEFLFVEDRTGQPIAQAIASWLAGTGDRVGLPMLRPGEYNLRRASAE